MYLRRLGWYEQTSKKIFDVVSFSIFECIYFKDNQMTGKYWNVRKNLYQEFCSDSKQAQYFMVTVMLAHSYRCINTQNNLNLNQKHYFAIVSICFKRYRIYFIRSTFKYVWRSFCPDILYGLVKSVITTW